MRNSDSVAELASSRILVLDGAMGTMIQSLGVDDADLQFADLPPVPGCHEILNLTRGDLIHGIHLSYVRCGADIIETNTFGANRFSLAGYGLEEYVYDINLAAVEIARAAIESFAQEGNGRPVFIAGVLGPTGKSASISPSVDDPSYREVAFDDFVAIYREQIEALLDGGVDLILVETVFDTLVAKAALLAASIVCEERNTEIPLMVSATFSDKSGRTLSGQTLEAFIDTLSPYKLFSLGLNCSTGPQEMIPLIETLARRSPFLTSAHPNAGFPDRDGVYTQTPAQLADLMTPLMEGGLLNIVGGCCGTTPAHIAALAHAAANGTPRSKPELFPILRLSGLESLAPVPAGKLITIGERTNVAGSRKFARLIRENSYGQALAIARAQIDEGAHVIDICMDDPLIDAREAMVKFLRLASADPAIAKVPFMIDSSDWSVITAALYELQGRAIVNSISLKEGPQAFLEKARHIVRMGAAMVVMLFDEQGQADTFERKIGIARRAYHLLVDGNICPPSSIIFDPNILAIATGIDEHDRYAADFLRSVAWITQHLPGVSISGGVSNLSFSFRGNNSLREAIHALFLEYAVDSGLDMAIVNPSSLVDPRTIPPEVATCIERVLLAEGDDPIADREALIALAMQPLELSAPARTEKKTDTQWRAWEPGRRLSQSVLLGEDSFLEKDLAELSVQPAVSIIEGPLMEGMAQVGKLFGEGKLFLPQVVRSARVMKRAVDILQPRLEQSPATGGSGVGTVVLATVKGDVHDIGKNIVSLVMQCNNIEVVDLGVMVPPQQILDAARERKAHLIALSGLITPSLTEMGNLCRLCKEQGLDIPIMIGGATTSEEHTALKLDPLYPGHVFHSTDASDAVFVALSLLGREREAFSGKIAQRYRARREGARGGPKDPLSVSYAKAEENRFVKVRPAPKPRDPGIHVIDSLKLADLLGTINWRMLCNAWNVPADSEEGRKLISDAKEFLGRPATIGWFESSMRAMIGLFEAEGLERGVVRIKDVHAGSVDLRFLRSQIPGPDGTCRSLGDYICRGQSDTIGMFVATTGEGIKRRIAQFKQEGDIYHSLLLQSVSDRITEAMSQHLQSLLESTWWHLGDVPSIRPAVGYPSVADHQQKQTIFDVLDATQQVGVRLTEGFAMDPVSSVCGFYFAGEGCSYFPMGAAEEDQLDDYARWRGVSMQDLERTLFVLESVADKEKES